MARKSPSLDTIKALLARSGNQCAFPDCSHPIINESNKLISQLCHIEAANKGGERYNSKQSDEQRREYENLVFLCYRHHVETNDENIFSVETLKKIKLDHEGKFKESKFKIEDDIILKKIKTDIDKFWIEVKEVHEVENTFPEDIKMEVNFNADINELFTDLRRVILGMNNLISMIQENEEYLEKDFKKTVKKVDKELYKKIKQIPYYKNSFANRNWEVLNLGVPNFEQKISIILDQIEIKIIESQLLDNHTNQKLRIRLDSLHLSLKDLSRNAGYND